MKRKGESDDCERSLASPSAIVTVTRRHVDAWRHALATPKARSCAHLTLPLSCPFAEELLHKTVSTRGHPYDIILRCKYMDIQYVNPYDIILRCKHSNIQLVYITGGHPARDPHPVDFKKPPKTGMVRTKAVAQANMKGKGGGKGSNKTNVNDGKTTSPSKKRKKIAAAAADEAQREAAEDAAAENEMLAEEEGAKRRRGG